MSTKTYLYRLALVGLFLIGTGISVADEAIINTGDDVDLCEPFLEGRVDGPLIDTMLIAAEQGHLYRIQKSTSRMGFCVQSTLSKIKGEFKDFQGGLALQPVASSDGLAMVVIKTDSVNVKGRLIENMVKGESFFDVDNHPEILFVSKSFEWTGEDRAVLKGDLTLRGITRPVVFDVTLTSIDGTWTDKAEKILVKATTSIERTAFGMKALSSMVDDTVTLCMSVEALKYKPDNA